MTIGTLLHIASVAATTASVLPVLMGLIGPRARAPGIRALWMWMIFGLMVNMIMWRMSSQNTKTGMLTQLTFPVFAALGLHAIGMLTTSRTLRRWCNMTTVGYILFWGWRFLHDEAAKDFSPFTGPVLWIILTLASAALVRARLAESPDQLLRDPVLITGLAVLLMYAPGAALEPASLALFKAYPGLTNILWMVRAALQVVAYFLLTMVFFWTLPPRSSPGLSSSVA